MRTPPERVVKSCITNSPPPSTELYAAMWTKLPSDQPVDAQTQRDYVLDATPQNPARTAGFDPTVLPSLLAAGYVSSWTEPTRSVELPAPSAVWLAPSLRSKAEQNLPARLRTPPSCANRRSRQDRA